jgi:integrase
VLSEDEMQRFMKALDSEPDIIVRAAFRMLLETGARKSEVLRARWDDLNLDATPPLWRIPSTKANKPQVIPLPSCTVEMLQEHPRHGVWVFPGRKPNQHLKDLRNPWSRLKAEAKLEAVTMHDLRRTFGLQVARESGLHIASKLLRHSDVRITEKVYAPLGIDELAAAIEKAQQNNHVAPSKKPMDKT